MADEFEKFLTRDAALKYNLKRFDIRWAYVESMGGNEALSKQLRADMLHADRFLNAVTQSLSDNPLERSKIAARWAAFLKTRIEVLEYWSSLMGATGALMVAGGALIAVVNGWPWFASVGVVFGAIAAVICKFEIDRKKLWYRFLNTSLTEVQ